MARLLPLLCALVTLTGACLVPPDDATQIARLERERAAASARDDARALYRLHDLDFRAVCPLDRFRALPHEVAAVRDVRAIETHGVRASAIVDFDRESGGSARREYVKDGGRWYLYESADACLGARRLADHRSPAAATWHIGAPTTLAIPTLASAGPAHG